MAPIIKKAWIIFTILLLLTLIAEIWMHAHIVFDIKETAMPGFHAVFGFGSCVAIVLFSKFIGIFLKRKTHYYNEEEK